MGYAGPANQVQWISENDPIGIFGALVQAVRAWVQGTKPPSGVARRLIGEIQHDPAYWRKRFGLGEPVKT